jgi:hypothetical protein
MSYELHTAHVCSGLLRHQLGILFALLLAHARKVIQYHPVEEGIEEEGIDEEGVAEQVVLVANTVVGTHQFVVVE